MHKNECFYGEAHSFIVSPRSMQELMISPRSMQELMVSPWSMQELMVSPRSMQELMVSPRSMQELMVSPQSMQELMVSPQSMQELMISQSMQEHMISPWSRYTHFVLYIWHRSSTTFRASLISINSVLLCTTSLIPVIFNIFLLESYQNVFLIQSRLIYHPLSYTRVNYNFSGP